MSYVHRVALLRLTALIAIAVSAVLTVDTISPGRDFCPLAEACAAARDSALGSIAGVPTSLIGLAAFGALLLLTLLPLEWSRPLLKPVGAFAALAGVGFVAYQHFVLHSFCPLCLVADGAGFLAGLLTLTWPRLPIRRSGRHIRWEGGSSRAAWTMAGLLAAVVPFAIPRAEDPGWVEITPLAEEAFRGEAPVVVAKAPPPPSSAPPVATGSTHAPDETRALTPVGIEPQGIGDAQAVTTPLPADDAQDPASGPAPAGVGEPDDPRDSKIPQDPAPTPVPPPAPSVDPTPAPAVTPSPQVRAPLMVEYLNAFCGHCRATHKRLHAVLEETGVEVRRRRVYTWGGTRTPDWARACAFAATRGLEDEMFEELLKARAQNRREIEAAAQRAGLSVSDLQTYLRRGGMPERLARDKSLVQRSGIRRLPTIDIGRRRLMGSQSATELRSALLAAAGRDS